jgi:hypothetical protein
MPREHTRDWIQASRVRSLPLTTCVMSWTPGTHGLVETTKQRTAVKSDRLSATLVPREFYPPFLIPAPGANGVFLSRSYLTTSLFMKHNTHMFRKEIIPTTSPPNLLSVTFWHAHFEIPCVPVNLTIPLFTLYLNCYLRPCISLQHWTQVFLFTWLNSVSTEDFQPLGYNGV